MNKAKRTNIPQEARKRAELQKEIGSRCPFCPSEDVGHFEIHHIDDDRTNHLLDNLLLLCKLCHSKFTKKEWPLIEAREKKDGLLKDVNFLLYHSEPTDSFDYTCFSMQEANGRLPEGDGNGSVAKIKVVDRYHFNVTIEQNDNRIWEGELILQLRDYGKIFFRYIGDVEFEFGRKECYLKQIVTQEYRDDILYFKPLTNIRDYGDELIKRRTYNK